MSTTVQSPSTTCCVENTPDIDTHRWCDNRLGDYGEMIEPLFDKEPDDSVRVEEEVAAAGLLIADDGIESLELGRLWEGVHRGREGIWHL